MTSAPPTTCTSFSSIYRNGNPAEHAPSPAFDDDVAAADNAVVAGHDAAATENDEDFAAEAAAAVVAAATPLSPPGHLIDDVYYHGIDHWR